MKHIAPHDRPREKLLSRGVHALSNEELLSLLLQCGSKKRSVLLLARHILRMLQKSGGNEGVIDFEALCRLDGMGRAKSCKVIAALELGRRLLERKEFQIRTSHDAISFLQEICDKQQEYFVMLSINGAQQMIQKHIISVGSVNALLVHPREVFLPAIRDNASSIIVAHNHPSGSLCVSEEDKLFTNRLVQAGKLLGIELLDHIILARKGWTSCLQ